MSRKTANVRANATALRRWECGGERREEEAAEQGRWKREINQQRRCERDTEDMGKNEEMSAIHYGGLKHIHAQMCFF